MIVDVFDRFVKRRCAPTRNEALVKSINCTVAELGYATEVCEDPDFANDKGWQVDALWVGLIISLARLSESTCMQPVVEHFKDLDLAFDLQVSEATVEAAVRVECGGKVGGVPPQQFAEHLIIFVLHALPDSDGHDVVVVIAGAIQVSARLEQTERMGLLWRIGEWTFAV